MSMLDMIPEREEKPSVNVFQTIKKKEPPQSINGILIALAIILLIGILTTYFVEELPDVVVDLRDISKQALWVFVGGFAIGELFKRVSVNRARNTKEYQEAQKEARTAVKKNAESKKTARAKAYCDDYAEKLYSSEKSRILGDAGVDVKEYEDKYFSLNKREIKRAHPDCTLSKKQFKAIRKANAVKKISYNPDFLRTVERTSRYIAPSELHDVKRRDTWNTVTSAGLGLVGSVFCVSFVQNLIFNFSSAVIFDAVVKVVMILIMIATKTQFGWSLVMDTEMSRLKLQKAEAERFSDWCDENPEKTKE